MAFFVKVQKNGKVYGKLGPYAERVDALLDAAALKRPGLKIAVVGASSARRAPVSTRRNYAQLMAQLAPVLLPIAKKIAKAQADKFMAADQAGRITMIRTFSMTSPALRIMLSNDQAATKAADALASILSMLGTPEGEKMLNAGATITISSLQKQTKANRK